MGPRGTGIAGERMGVPEEAESGVNESEAPEAFFAGATK